VSSATPPLPADTLARLNRAASHVNTAMRSAMLAEHCATSADVAEGVHVAGAANAAVMETQKALALLLALGARPAKIPDPEPVPLHLLDTPDARELLALLRQAVAVAERLDQARGRAMPPNVELLPEETRGLDFAEALADLSLRLEMEIFGPADRRQEARGE